MKAKKCIECEKETYQADQICVTCKIGITRIHAELIDLLKKDKKWNLQKLKIAKTG
jgi:hypothetical protein